MNKEVNYVLQGFLVTLVLIGAFKFSGYLLSIPAPPEEPEHIGMCGNADTPPEPPYTVSSGPNGKIIFQDNCASCHALFKDLTGPALAGVTERITDKKLLYKWVRNPAGVLRSGNVYFNDLKKKFGNVEMTPFAHLTDEEIDAVFRYIETRGKQNIPVQAAGN